MEDLIIQTSNKKHIIAGDSNINILSKNLITLKYIDLIKSYNYTVSNNLITRPQSGSNIDQIITNFENTSSFTIQYDHSDHNAVFSFIKWSLTNTVNKTPLKLTKTEVNYELVH